MKRALVIGANRGIGLELCRQLAARGDEVLATSRRPSSDLASMTGVKAYPGVDVTEPESLVPLVAEVGEGSVDLLLMVAGILKGGSLNNFDAAVIREQFEVNALGVVGATVALLPCIRSGGKIGLLTSRMGSNRGQHLRRQLRVPYVEGSAERCRAFPGDRPRALAESRWRSSIRAGSRPI